MPRQKEYNEKEVIEKAMYLFWRNGYENTSTRMLEKEMGINQFSIYSSFGNKQGVLIESIKCYKNKIKEISDKLKESKEAVEGIKQYFYDFIEFTKEDEHNKGCLLINTANELGIDGDPLVLDEIIDFMNDLITLFVGNLKINISKNEKTILKQANYLIISITGLSVASKVFSEEQLHDYIETTFKNI